MWSPSKPQHRGGEKKREGLNDIKDIEYDSTSVIHLSRDMTWYFGNWENPYLCWHTVPSIYDTQALIYHERYKLVPATNSMMDTAVCRSAFIYPNLSFQFVVRGPARDWHKWKGNVNLKIPTVDIIPPRWKVCLSIVFDLTVSFVPVGDAQHLQQPSPIFIYSMIYSRAIQILGRKKMLI